jgi:chitinase
VRTWLLTPVILAAVSSAAFGAPADLSVGDVRIVEGHNGIRSVEITVSVSPAAPGPVTATYVTRDGTALAATDFRAANGTVAFAPGEIVKKIEIGIIGETVIEADETFDLVLSNVSGATLADPAATVLIVNDDFQGRARGAPALVRHRTARASRL